MIKHCDMYGGEIENGSCLCGEWKSAEEVMDNPMKKGLEMFHEMKQMTFSCDAPYLGCAVIYFRGDYKDCKEVEKFIFTMKKRPYYDSH